MGRHLLIVTGYPGAGKSYTSAVILGAFPEIKSLSYDALKEEWFDREGFDSAEEKFALTERCLRAFFEILNSEMKHGGDLLIEYPFCQKHVAALKQALAENDYTPITVVLDGDPAVLWERFAQRDKESTRHQGHLCNVYHKDGVKVLKPRLSLEEYTQDCAQKNYYINLGATMTLDMTDLSKVRYDGLLSFLREHLAS